jgi:hypothetical protein
MNRQVIMALGAWMALRQLIITEKGLSQIRGSFSWKVEHSVKLQDIWVGIVVAYWQVPNIVVATRRVR